MILSVTACSSAPKVHVFGKYLSDEQKSAIEKSFVDNEYEVTFNQLSFPKGISQNTVVYNAEPGSKSHTRNIIKLVESLGFPVEATNLILADSHSFTVGNLGLYLVPEGSHDLLQKNQSFDLELLNEYGAVNCLYSATLSLEKFGMFSIEVEKWDKTKQDYIVDNVKGEWQLMNSDYLKLTSESLINDLYFTKKKEQVEIGGRNMKVVKFVPMNGYHESMPIAQYNCTYSIMQDVTG